jgi:hypothetical protein
MLARGEAARFVEIALQFEFNLAIKLGVAAAAMRPGNQAAMRPAPRGCAAGSGVAIGVAVD